MDFTVVHAVFAMAETALRRYDLSLNVGINKLMFKTWLFFARTKQWRSLATIDPRHSKKKEKTSHTNLLINLQQGQWLDRSSWQAPKFQFNEPRNPLVGSVAAGYVVRFFGFLCCYVILYTYLGPQKELGASS